MPNDAKTDGPQFRNHRDCQSLTGLTLEQLPRDGSLGRVRHYRKGADVWQLDDREHRLYFLKQGQVAVIMSEPAGHEMILRLIEAGEPFGELCFCSAQERRRTSGARAVTDSQVVEIQFIDFMKYLQNSRDALNSFVFTFCMRLADAERRIEVLAHRGSKERLGRLLLQLAASRGKPSAKRTGERTLGVSHEELAQMAAMSRPHVSVTMGKFRRGGLIRYGRSSPLVVNVASLTSYLSGD